MPESPNRVCPVERAGHLDSRLRRWLQRPRRMLSQYLEPGMHVLDLGCGPGFFTVEMARLVGPEGRVLAADLQQGMLDKVRDSLAGTGLEGRVQLHRCEEDRIGVAGPLDFALAYYVVHEIPDQGKLFAELASVLRPQAALVVVEPPFHVTRKAFAAMVENARAAGFAAEAGPSAWLSKSVTLRAGPDAASD